MYWIIIQNILDTLLLFEVRLLYEDGVIYKIKRSEVTP